MSHDVNRRFSVKGQFNEPRHPEGRRIEVLQPGKYKRNVLLLHPEEIGLQGLNGFWGIHETADNCPVVLVSCTGIVAVRFPNKEDWRVLMQQWNYQGQEAEAQKYLEVWFAENPFYPDGSTAHQLHRLVGIHHVNYTDDC